MTIGKPSGGVPWILNRLRHLLSFRILPTTKYKEGRIISTRRVQVSVIRDKVWSGGTHGVMGRGDSKRLVKVVGFRFERPIMVVRELDVTKRDFDEKNWDLRGLDYTGGTRS